MVVIGAPGSSGHRSTKRRWQTLRVGSTIAYFDAVIIMASAKATMLVLLGGGPCIGFLTLSSLLHAVHCWGRNHGIVCGRAPTSEVGASEVAGGPRPTCATHDVVIQRRMVLRLQFKRLGVAEWL